MATKKNRDVNELKNLLDPKYSRNFWRTVGNAIAARPAVKPVDVFDKEGRLTADCKTEKAAYEALANDLKILQQDRQEPTQLEMIMASQMIVARTNPAAAIFVRDTLGAKPVDESKIDQTINEYAGLSDDELEMLAKMRAKNAKIKMAMVQAEPSPTDILQDDLRVAAIDCYCSECGHRQFAGGDIARPLETHACIRCGKKGTLQYSNSAPTAAQPAE